MRVVVLNFSARKTAGNSRTIAAEIERSFPLSRIIHFSDMEVNRCNKCDYQCFKEVKLCKFRNDDVLSIYNEVMSSDLTIYIIPNHSGWPNSNYFAFNERSQSVFNVNNYEVYNRVRKHFIILSNTSPDNIINLIKGDFKGLCADDITVISSRYYGQSSIKGKLLESQNFIEFLKVEVIDKIKEKSY